MQNWVLTELDSGERVITERLDHVRSAAVGYWIGAGSRDEEAPEAGVSHFIEHLLFKGTSRYSALEIAEIFDGLGGELNAATSREHTLVYARIPDHHLVTAVDVMSDMVFAPAFAELETEREVVLEEIAMYEDAPQELVHDLIADAVFGDHPLGRPVIGTAEVISSIPQDAIARYHDEMYVPSNIVVAAAGNIQHEQIVELVQQGLERRAGQRSRPREPAAAARAGTAAAAALPAQGHRAVPRLPRCAGHLAVRPEALRRVAARCDSRRLGVVAALPGDPREARDGVRGVLVHLAVHRHGPDRRVPRDARGQPRRRARDHRRADRRHRRREPDRGRSSSVRRRT